MSSLWIPKVTVNKIKNKIKPSPKHISSNLSLARDLTPRNNKVNFIKKYSNNYGAIKRISLLTFFGGQRKLAGSMTVEAAFVMPLLIFFFLNLTASIEIIRLSGNLDLAMWDAGKRLSVYAYAYDSMVKGENEPDDNMNGRGKPLTDKLAGIAFTSLWAGNEVTVDVGREYLDKSPVKGGADGIYFGSSSFLEENDCIKLVAVYQVEPLTTIAGFGVFTMHNRIVARAWTGYELPIEQEKGDCVYITETGTVYHESRECTYIRLVIRSVHVSEIDKIRNESGGRYEICWICKDANSFGQAFVARTGTKYHFLKGCSALKRTVMTIKRSDAGSYRKCSRCCIS